MSQTSYDCEAGTEQPRPILLIDDDVELCLLMAEYFGQHGYMLTPIHDGGTGLSRALKSEHELVILDVMLPALNGFEVLRQLRAKSDIPAIMLTARTTEHERISGLNAGADDYLPKPFAPDELLARIRAVLRRTERGSQAQTSILESHNIRINLKTREVWRASEPVQLTAFEFEVLVLLLRASGRVISRDEIYAALYQRQCTPYERSLDVHISHLRRKIDSSERALIRTIRGVGYLFSASR